MKLEVLSTSVVVLAEAHNPSILHPAFLVSEGIVPADWEPADPPICTPLVSVAKYANGITFTIDSNRLVVTEERPAGNPTESQVWDRAIAYAEKLPHVRYTALGLNFNGFCLRQAPEQFLIERFLKAGPWDNQARPMKALGARFVYHVDDAVLRLGIDGGHVQWEDKPEPAVIVNANFHSKLPGEKPLEALRRLANRWPARLADFNNLTGVVLGMEKSE